MNKQQLASKIWASANKMRSKIEANEYKDYILGFIFYKFLSEKEEEHAKNILGWNDEDIKNNLKEENKEVVVYLQNNLGFFISFDNLFSTWISLGKDFSVDNVRTALSAFNRLISPKFIKIYEKIFDTLDTGLSKLGDSSNTQTKAINDLINLIKDIPMNGKQDYDVLGFIYEYLLSNFAANAGKKAGEFYTPHEVSVLMSKIVAHHLKNKKEIKIYDPTSGSGSLLITIGKSASKYLGDTNSILYYAQELKANTYNLTRMNLVMRGINPANIFTRNADTLEDDWPIEDDNGIIRVLTLDAVVSNPPYSQVWDPEGKESDPRFSNYGIAPKSKADYAFLLHDLYHIDPNGIVTIVLPHGVLFRGGEEEKIRKNLIEYNNIDVIIGLPANIFFGTGIPTIIMVLKKNRPTTDVLFIDASKGFIKEGKGNKLRSSDIKKIVDTTTTRNDIPKYSRCVSKDEIRKNEYNLNIPRYVDSTDKQEPYDIFATVYGGIPNAEIDDLDYYFSEFPKLKKLLFEQKGDTPYSSLKNDDVEKVIEDSEEIKEFKKKYEKNFADFHAFAKESLIGKIATMNISNEEDVLAENIFKRISFTDLIDKYDAYQVLDDHYSAIYSDLEMIRNEGLSALKKVNPHMVTKREGKGKEGKEIEVQDGWEGHILPFALVQENVLADKLKAIRQMEEKSETLNSEIISIYSDLDEEEKGEGKDGISNEDESNFEFKKVLERAKLISDEKKNKGLKIVKGSFEEKILIVAKKVEEIKKTNSEIRKEQKKLVLETKETIEKLSDSDAIKLLENKWIDSLEKSLLNMPKDVITNLTNSIAKLYKKYAIPLKQTEDDILKREKELLGMLCELDGDEYDLKGISGLKTIFGGSKNE